jgi:hypothetical protein
MSESKRKRVERATTAPKKAPKNAPAPTPEPEPDAKTETEAPEAPPPLTDEEIDALSDDFVFYDQQMDEYCHYRDIRDFAAFMTDMNMQIAELSNAARRNGEGQTHYKHLAHGEMQEKHIVNYEALNGAVDARLISSANAAKWKVPLFIKRVQDLHAYLYPKVPIDDIHVSGYEAMRIASLLDAK